jgi:hypothetical protein
MGISAISDIGISTYVVTRVSARKGETPPVDAVDSVDSSQQGPSEEISWMEAMSLFGSSGAVVQRLSIMSGRSASTLRPNDPEVADELSRRAAENAGRPRSSQRPGAEEVSEDSPRPDPIRRLIDAVTERAQGVASSQQWTGERIAAMSEMLQQFRGDVRQAAQTYDPRSAKRDDFLNHLSDAFAKFDRSLESGSGADSAADDSADIAGVGDALTDSAISPDTLRAAFASELANLRMTLSELDTTGQSSPRPADENLQIEQYRAMQQERLEQVRSEQYQPQLNAVA